ncbi:MAG: tripartite tricarboxylate transporter substrate binding protein [Sporomusaceae bacterium]|nr:tripartite tricarboxylate transporter substrate binding protein [Sporomusaceae bacterium]
MLRKGIVVAMLLVFVLAAVGCGGTQKTEAPKFPTKAISIIVPFAAGGGTDAVARSIAKYAEPVFGQPVTVVNKVGANGATGMTEGVNSPADGYMVTMVTVETVTNPIQGNVKWKPTDFKAVMQVNSDASAVTVPVDSPFKTLQDLLKAAKEKPGTLKVGTVAPGAIWHTAGLGLQEKADVKFNLVPYPGGAAPIITDLLGGHLDATTVSAAEVSQHVKAGKLRILAVLAPERLKGFPNIPTAKEQGVDVAVATWRGLAVPAKTPDAVVKTLHDGFKKSMDDPKFIEFMEKGNFGMTYRDSAGFQKYMDEQTKFFEPLLQKAGLTKKQ